MKHKYNILLASCLLMIGISCSAPRHTIVTLPANHIDSTTAKGLVYYLPQSVCRITINVLQVSTIPGPYHAFADKFLGIKNVPHERDTEWMLSDMKVAVVEEPDPAQFYLVTSEKGAISKDLLDRLRSKGISVYTHREMPFISDYNETMDAARGGGLFYTDLSMKDNAVFETDTLYKTILTDSSFVRVPVIKKQETIKTIEERAREASDFLIKIRKRRFRLLTGMDGFYPQDDAIRFGTGELDKLEQSYLSLFIGKTITDTIRLNFIHIPVMGQSLEQTRLFEFSPTEGINARTGSDRIVSLMLKKTGVTNQLANYSRQNNRFPAGVVYYRIPDVAEMEIQVDGMAVLRDRISVYQYGTVVACPVNY